MQIPIELKLKYLERRIQDIQNLKSYMQNNDFSYALKLGHQVKGNAVTFDFPQLAFIGMQIEKAAMKSDKEKINILLDKMESAIELARTTLPPQ
jgi:HPt (histidine-containing phosphotransfer) domain-containing protein